MQNAKVLHQIASRQLSGADDFRPRSRHAGSRSWLRAFAVCILPFAFAAAKAIAGVDESKIVHTYYVDPSGANAADDNDHGTQDSPFLTLKHALDTAVHDKDANVGAKVIIAPGTYREPLDIPPPPGNTPDTDAPLVLEAAERDQTIFDAADTAGWEPGTWKIDGNVWTHPLPVPPAPVRPERGERNEHHDSPAALLVVNGLVARQTDRATALVPGTCIVAPPSRHGAPATLLFAPPEDAELADAAFALGARDHCSLITGRRNVTVRGLLFQHAASAGGQPSAGLVLRDCSDVLVEDVLSQWSDGAGLSVTGRNAAPWTSGITLRRVQLIHNGAAGLAAANLQHLLAEDCETSFNNFRGEWAALATPDAPGGVRAHSLHGSTWRRQRAVANFGRGLAWTGDCTDLVVEDAVVRDNLFSGVHVENSPGPTRIRGCLIAGNKTLAGNKVEATQPSAVSFDASPDVTLENNVVAGNSMPQLGLRDTPERNDDVNFETGAKIPLHAERHAYHHNVFYGADATQTLIDLPAAERAGKADFTPYFATLDSDENCFWNPAATDVFNSYEHATHRRTAMSLAAWRTLLTSHANPSTDHQPESGSLWQDPHFMEPVEGDYRLQTDSPLIDWGLPSEEGAAAQ